MQLFPSNSFYELLHPKTDEPTGLILELLPSDHDQVTKALFNAFKAQRGKTELEFDSMLTQRIATAAACIAGWEIKNEDWLPILKSMGIEDTIFSIEKVTKLLSRPDAGWIRAQIDTVIADKDRVFQPALQV
jgi:hypothetical protein